jgi:hypothetical protein
MLGCRRTCYPLTHEKVHEHPINRFKIRESFKGPCHLHGL